MEAVELGVLMFCICLTGTLVYSRDSPRGASRSQ